MRKRKAKNDGTVRTVETIVEYEDGGIYLREKVVGQKYGMITRAEREAILKGLGDCAGQFRTALQRTASHAATIVLPHVQQHVAPGLPPPGCTNLLFDLGDGERRTVVPTELPIEIAEAIEALKIVRSLQKRLDRDPSDAYWLVEAYELGRLDERMRVRPHEPNALKGKRQAQRARQAGKSRQLLTVDQQRQAAAEIAALVNNGMDVEPACKSLVSQYGVSYKTLKRYYQGRTTV